MHRSKQLLYSITSPAQPQLAGAAEIQSIIYSIKLFLRARRSLQYLVGDFVGEDVFVSLVVVDGDAIHGSNPFARRQSAAEQWEEKGVAGI